MTVEMKITCSHCGAEHVVGMIAGVNADNEPELKAKVRDGSAFVAECPYCGYRSLIAGQQLLYHDPSSKFMVWLLPEGTSVQEGLISQGVPGLDGYTLRRVLTAGDMIEKVSIFDSGLDDRVMELCKHVTRMELAEGGAGKDVLDAPMKFFRMDGPDNSMTFSYPSDGKMQLAEVGFNVYEDCRGILARNPSVKEDPGFAVVDPDWVARFFR